jgi:hypothetical protein
MLGRALVSRVRFLHPASFKQDFIVWLISFAADELPACGPKH